MACYLTWTISLSSFQDFITQGLLDYVVAKGGAGPITCVTVTWRSCSQRFKWAYCVDSDQDSGDTSLYKLDDHFNIFLELYCTVLLFKSTSLIFVCALCVAIIQCPPLLAVRVLSAAMVKYDPRGVPFRCKFRQEIIVIRTRKGSSIITVYKRWCVKISFVTDEQLRC